MTEISSVRYKRLLLITSLLVLVAAILSAGCTVGERTPAKTETLLISGSTTVLPVAQLTAEAFMAENPDVDLQISGGGSSVGIQAAGSGTADIGMASRDLKESEKEAYPDLVKHVVALDGIVIIVNPENSLGGLTLDEVRGIYNGTYTNWNQVGGSEAQIVVVGRDSASGTREFFSEFVMDAEDFTRTQEEFNSNGGIQQKVSQTPGAFGYVGLGYTEGVKPLALDVGGTSVRPTLQNIKDGTYPISRPLYMLTNGEPEGLAQRYIEFILSAEGQEIVASEDYIPVRG